MAYTITYPIFCPYPLGGSYARPVKIESGTRLRSGGKKQKTGLNRRNYQRQKRSEHFRVFANSGVRLFSIKYLFGEANIAYNFLFLEED